MCGDSGISADCPPAPSITISAVAAISASAEQGRQDRCAARPTNARKYLRLGDRAHRAGSSQSAVHTVFVSRYASSPSRPCSRPIPDALKPPNGAAGSDCPQLLMYTEPARSNAARRWALERSRVQTPAASPYSFRWRARRPPRGVVGRRHQHRSEYLLARDPQVVRGRAEEGRLDEVAAALGSAASPPVTSSAPCSRPEAM